MIAYSGSCPNMSTNSDCCIRRQRLPVDEVQLAIGLRCATGTGDGRQAARCRLERLEACVLLRPLVPGRLACRGGEAGLSSTGSGSFLNIGYVASLVHFS